MADPEFYNGGRTVEGEGSGEGLCPGPPQKIFFYLKKVDFGAFYDYLFTFMQKLVRSMGAAAPTPESATVLLWTIPLINSASFDNEDPTKV